MEEKHRKLIIQNKDKLIRCTDYEKLISGCVEAGLLTSVMRQNIENILEPLFEEDLRHERHKRLFKKLTQRGPEAYCKFKVLLADLGYKDALNLLEVQFIDDTGFLSLHKYNKKLNTSKLKVSQSTESEICSKNEEINEMPELIEYTKEIQPSKVIEVIKSKRVYIDTKLGTYPMQTKHNRGVFFMVNIIDFPNKDVRRNGAEKDGQSLLYLFKELGFKLFAYENLTQKQFFHLLNEIINSDYARLTECFVMVLMTHGNVDDQNKERIQFHDGSVGVVSDILDCFKHHVCPNLVHKPKLFIFPFCRGDGFDNGYYTGIQTDSISHAPSSNISTCSDIVICYASTLGNRAHRDPVQGSWYIQIFYEIMAENAHNTDFVDIIKLIQSKTAKLRTECGTLQTGCYNNIGFNRKLYFNPGAWNE